MISFTFGFKLKKNSMIRQTTFYILLLLSIVTFNGFSQSKETVEIKSSFPKEVRKCTVHLPKSYHLNLYQNYPVLYVLDGQVAGTFVPAVTQIFADRDRAPEVIVVSLPSNGTRSRDYTPKGKEHDGISSGGADQFLNYLEKELIPYIDKNYRTEPFRILSGESRGGLLTLHAFIERTTLFQAYFMLSPALYHNEEEIVARLENFLRTSKPTGRFIYMNIGSEGNIFRTAFDNTWQVFKEYSNNKLELHVETLSADYHGLTGISGHHNAYLKLFNNWRTPFKVVENEGAKGVISHFERLSERYGYTVKPPEASNNSYGYTFYRRKNYDVMLGLLKLNVELYPESANAYDSLAEGLEALGKTTEAIELMKKAIKIAKKNNDHRLENFQNHLNRLLKNQ